METETVRGAWSLAEVRRLHGQAGGNFFRRAEGRRYSSRWIRWSEDCQRVCVVLQSPVLYWRPELGLCWTVWRFDPATCEIERVSSRSHRNWREAVEEAESMAGVCREARRSRRGGVRSKIV